MPADRILIVEDEVLLAADTREELVNEGFDVVGMATTGQDAVKLAEAEEPDLILMDIRLKGDLDGVSTAGFINARHPTPVVFMTAFSDDDFLRRAQAVEPYGYLIKPVDARALVATIRLALFKARREREREAAQQELDAIVSDLQVRDGYVSVCTGCHAIRTTEGEWLHVVVREADFAGVPISHGICPDCIAALYPRKHGSD